MAVQEHVGRVQRDVVLAHIPDALVSACFAPRVLHHIVLAPLLVLRLAVDQHHVVVGGLPRVEPLLAQFLRGCRILLCQSLTVEAVAAHVAAPAHVVASVYRRVDDVHQRVEGHVVARSQPPLVGRLYNKRGVERMVREAGVAHVVVEVQLQALRKALRRVLLPFIDELLRTFA